MSHRVSVLTGGGGRDPLGTPSLHPFLLVSGSKASQACHAATPPPHTHTAHRTAHTPRAGACEERAAISPGIRRCRRWRRPSPQAGAHTNGLHLGLDDLVVGRESGAGRGERGRGGTQDCCVLLSHLVAERPPVCTLAEHINQNIYPLKSTNTAVLFRQV